MSQLRIESILISAAVFVGGFILLCGGSSAYAQTRNLSSADDLLKESGVGTGVETGDLSTVSGVIATALQLVLSLLGTIMFGYMVYAGYLWMTAQGEEGQVTKAKGIMVNTVIGFLVVVSAWAITYLVQSRFR